MSDAAFDEFVYSSLLATPGVFLFYPRNVPENKITSVFSVLFSRLVMNVKYNLLVPRLERILPIIHAQLILKMLTFFIECF